MAQGACCSLVKQAEAHVLLLLLLFRLLLLLLLGFLCSCAPARLLRACAKLSRPAYAISALAQPPKRGIFTTHTARWADLLCA